jgi:hypothetical protein
MKINSNIFLDDVNLQIIDILAKDSSTIFVEIAKQIGISDATVHLRVRVGYDHLAFMRITLDQVLQIRLPKSYQI